MKYIGYFLLFILVGITIIFTLPHTKDVTEKNESEIEVQPKETETDTPVTTHKTIRLVAIGDSLTEGVGDETKQGGYVNILTKKLQQNGRVVYSDNFGKKGIRSEQLLQNIQEEEVTQAIKKADILIVTIGANDMMQVLKENVTNIRPEMFSKAQKNYAKNLEDILATLRQINANSAIYLVGLYNPLEAYFADMKELQLLLENWNTIAEDLAQKHANADFIPVADLFKETKQQYLAEDRVHPNHLGYEKIAERILQHLQTNEGAKN